MSHILFNSIVGMAFWIFLAIVVVAAIWLTNVQSKEMQKTIRHAIDKGVQVDAELVAVEVCCLPAHTFNNKPATRSRTEVQRLEYILNRGWFVAYLLGTARGQRYRFDLSIIGDDLLALLKVARSDESTRGKYGVIWGHGEPPAAAKYDFKSLPFVPGFGCGNE